MELFFFSSTGQLHQPCDHTWLMMNLNRYSWSLHCWISKVKLNMAVFTYNKSSGEMYPMVGTFPTQHPGQLLIHNTNISRNNNSQQASTQQLVLHSNITFTEDTCRSFAFVFLLLLAPTCEESLPRKWAWRQDQMCCICRRERGLFFFLFWDKTWVNFCLFPADGSSKFSGRAVENNFLLCCDIENAAPWVIIKGSFFPRMW